MLYCPKCQKNYSDGSQRFCDNDGVRLLPAPVPGKSSKLANNVFTSILGRTAPAGEKDEKLAAIPRFTKTDEPREFEFTPPENATVFKSEPKISVENKNSQSKPLGRIVRPYEIPVSQAKLGDRKINPMGRPALTWKNTDVLLGQVIKGRYRITEKSAEDDASVTYLAEDNIVPHKKVLIRVLMDEEREDSFSNRIFVEERVSLSHVNHPNVASVIDSSELPEGKPFIVTEFVEGKSVKDMMRGTGQFNALRAARIIRQASYALSEMHQNGILHRNLRPEDIILTVSESGAEQVKLTNFGVADKINRENIAYKSPEQIEGKTANFASDIYTLAVIAYQMLTNRLPFNGSSADAFLKAQREGLTLYPTNLRLDLPFLVDKILEKALSFNAAERFPKARDFGDAFFNALNTVQPWEQEKTEEDAIELPDFFTKSDEAELEIPPVEEEEVVVVSPENSLLEIVEPEETSADSGSVKATEDLAWEKRSPEPVKVASPRWKLLSILGFALLLVIIWGVWYYFLNRPSQPAFIAMPVENQQTTLPPQDTNLAPQSVEIESPPLPRIVPQPPNTTYFENTRQNMEAGLLKNFLGFSLYYPKDWTKTDSPGNFLDVSKKTADGIPLKQMIITRYDSKGTFKADKELFAKLAEKSNQDLEKILPNYAAISETETTIQNGRWKVYEVKFQGGNGDIDLKVWGRRLWIPVQRQGTRSGFVITLLATSNAPDVKGVEDVGTNDELAAILETFEVKENF